MRKLLSLAVLLAFAVSAQTPVMHNQGNGTIYASPGGQSFDWPDGTKINGVEVHEAKVNPNASTDPGVNDDNTAGYSVGSMWWNTTADSGWLCLDASTGAAVWKDITSVTGSGESNTATNVGTAGVGLWKDKSGVTLRFKKINAGSSKITVTDDTGNDELDIDIAEANVDHDALSNYDANEHVDHSAVSIDTTGGIAGGGDLTSTRTLTLDLSTLTENASPVTTDIVVTEQVATGSQVKTTLADLPKMDAAVGHGGDAFGTDGQVIRSHGTGEDVQTSGVTISDTDVLTVPGQTSTSAQICIREGATTGTQILTLLAQDSLGSDVTWRFPGENGSADDLLVGLGSGEVAYRQISEITTESTLDADNDYLLVDVSGTGLRAVLLSDVRGSAVGTMTTVKEDDSQTGGADIATLDFGTGFDITESPDTEIQVSFDVSEFGGVTPTLADTIVLYDTSGTATAKATLTDLQTLIDTDTDTDTTYSAGDGLTLTTTTFSIGAGDITATHLGTDSAGSDEVAANAIGDSELASTTVAAGSYTVASITVNEDGRLTGAASGTDDDVPDAGDFGNATDLDSNGALNADSVDSVEIVTGAILETETGERVATVQLFGVATDTATGDTASDVGIMWPHYYSGSWDLVDVEIVVKTAGTGSGTTSVQVSRSRAGSEVDMLTTVASIDVTEYSSDDGATPFAINGSNDDMAGGDVIVFDVDSVSTTAAQGLWVTLVWRRQ